MLLGGAPREEESAEPEGDSCCRLNCPDRRSCAACAWACA